MDNPNKNERAWQAWEREQEKLRAELPDLQPTTPARALKRCHNPHCDALIYRHGPDLCTDCRALFFAVAELRNRVRTGKLSDWSTMDHRTGLAMERVKGIAVPAWTRTKQIIVNTCYTLRWMPWRSPYYGEGFDNQLA